MSDNYPIASFVAALKGDITHASFTSQDILNQEVQGQADFVSSCEMPKEGNWTALEQMGFIRGEDVNDLFCNATLPNGWVKEATDHSMWSYIKDNRGLIRIKTFYKAAFYDRKANFTVLKNRFSSHQYGDKSDQNGIQFVVYDDGLNSVAIKVCAPVYYATLDYGDGNTILGATHQGLFYAVTGGSKYDESFTDFGVQHQSIQIITKDEFWKKHHDNPRHDLVASVEKLAYKEADEWLNQIPKDLTQWSTEFDFTSV